MSEISVNPQDIAKELGPAADAPIGPHIGVASIALNMAMKYHDINTIQDGALYQQYKLEGKNIAPLHLDMVFDTAIEIEKHLVRSHKRVTDALLATLLEVDETQDDKSAFDAANPATDETPTQ